MIDAREEQIRLYSRQLKIPTFASYRDVLRQSKPDADFSDLLLDLMMCEAASRQEKQTRRRLKAADFPLQKTLEEFDMSRLNSRHFCFVQVQGICGRSCKYLAPPIGAVRCTDGDTHCFNV